MLIRERKSEFHNRPIVEQPELTVIHPREQRDTLLIAAFIAALWYLMRLYAQLPTQVRARGCAELPRNVMDDLDQLHADWRTARYQSKGVA